ncbi:hypothetical protein AO058_17730 [Salegentibacter sp. T436]|nr:hypothetical protein AO058_17730 [Salegentibacter sp. T436]
MQFRGLKNSILLVIISVFFINCEGVPIEYLENDEILSFEIKDLETGEALTEALGDGENQIQLIANISEKADPKYRTITFETSGGQFISNGGKSIDKKVDVSGQSSVILEVPLSKDRIYLSAKIKNEAYNIINEKFIDLLEFENIIKLEILGSSGNELTQEVVADGSSIITLRAIVEVDMDEFQNVTFKKSKGEFLGVDSNQSIKPIDQDGIAEIQFEVPIESGRVYFSAEIGNNDNQYIVEQFVDLQKAFPNELLIESNSTSITKSNPIDLTVYTLRDNGKASDGIVVNFKAYQTFEDDTLSIGRFTNRANATTSNGVVSGVKFYIDTNDYNPDLDIVIEAYSEGSGQAEVSDSVKIDIIE